MTSDKLQFFEDLELWAKTSPKTPAITTWLAWYAQRKPQMELEEL
jgi:hypothetical protein